VETTVRHAHAQAVPVQVQAPDHAPPGKRSRQSESASHQSVSPRLAQIPDAEVARLTDRVVQHINRRILAERERRGRP
jgi:hypothetical protein